MWLFTNWKFKLAIAVIVGFYSYFEWFDGVLPASLCGDEAVIQMCDTDAR
jgi:hypothetical protein